MNDAIALANRSIQFASREAAGAAGGLMEWFLAPDNRTRRDRLMEDWLDFNGIDAGYGLGLIAAICSAIGMMFALPWVAGLLLLAAFALCWYFA